MNSYSNISQAKACGYNKLFNKLLPFVIFIVIFAVYIFTAYPTIAPYRDSGDLIAAGYTLGIPHPPGYPLYSILGKIATILIPWGNIAYKINLVSIFFAAVTVAIITIVFDSILAGTIAGLMFGVSNAVWSLAHVSEMYTLSAFFAVLLVYILLKTSGQKTNLTLSIKYLLLSAFVFGLGLSSHPTLILLLPGIGFWYLQQNQKQRFAGIKFHNHLVILIYFFLGLSIYLYLPLRSALDPVLDWGNPENLKNFLRVVTRADYGGLKLHPEQSKFMWSVSSITAQCKLFTNAVLDQFGITGLILGIIGIYYSFIKKTSGLLLTNFLIAGIGFFLLSNLPPGEKTTLPILEPHLVLPNMIFVLFVGYTLARLFSSRLKILSLVFLILPVYLFVQNIPYQNVRSHFFAYDFGKNVLQTIKPGSILYNPDDPTTFITTYLQVCNKKREDVKLATYFRTFWGYERIKKLYPEILPGRKLESAQKFVRALFEYNLNTREIYTDVSVKTPEGHTAFPQGLLSVIGRKEGLELFNNAENLFNLYIYRGKFHTDLYKDFFTKRILTYYAAAHNNLGIEYAGAGIHTKAQQHYKTSLIIEPEMSEALNNLGTIEYREKKYDNAINLFGKALKLKPDDCSLLYNIGVSYRSQGDMESAEKYFRESVKKGFYPQSLNELGLLELDHKNYTEAISIFENLLSRSPDYYLAYYNLGLAYQKNGDFKKSVDSYKNYLKYITDPNEKQTIEKMIEKLVRTLK